jgi:hemoglobin
MLKQISDLSDIKVLVNTFYDKVRQDELLAPIFDEVIRDNWPVHLEKMYSFWQTVLLEEHTYNGSPFFPHIKLPIEAKHFERWLLLFIANINEHFEGEKANEAIWRAEKMAEMFQMKKEYLNRNKNEA